MLVTLVALTKTIISLEKLVAINMTLK